uniref:Ovule protein n=1 Tax=Haemonchus placei TaxID=6290 RepID=A0A0N4WGH9_HAEPC
LSSSNFTSIKPTENTRPTISDNFCTVIARGTRFLTTFPSKEIESSTTSSPRLFKDTSAVP